MKLHAHHFAELLESLHELLIISVLGHGLFGVRFKHVNCLHVLRVREKFVNLIVRSNVVKKVLGHPLLSCFVKIVVHFHRLLNLLYLQGVFLSRFQFRYLLLFLFSLLRCSRSTSSWKESFLKACKFLFLFVFLYFFLDFYLLALKCLFFFGKLLLIFNMPDVHLGVILFIIFWAFCRLIVHIDGFDVSLEVIKFGGELILGHYY